MGAIERGGEGRHGQVDPDEPQQLRNHDERCHDERRLRRGPRRQPGAVGDDTEQDPHGKERERWAQQARGPGPNERGIPSGTGAAAAGEGAKRVGVRDAAHEEEQWHDLQDPGDRLQPGDEVEGVGDLAGWCDGHHEPVPDDDDEQGADA